MYIHWKSLLSLGFACWVILYSTDLLGEANWKKCSIHLDELVKSQLNIMAKNQQNQSGKMDTSKQINWPIVLWNICAFLCSLVFCSVLRSMSWIVWKVFKIYNVFRNRKTLTHRLSEDDKKENCKLIFKNQMFNSKDELKRQEGTYVQEHLSLIKELEELKKEKNQLSQQLLLAEKNNETARQQLDQFKLETFMVKEKLARTESTLKENLKYKDFANANQELIARKAHNLELHLKEVTRDRDILRNKLSNMEKNVAKLEDRVKMYQKQESDIMEQYPEKDTTKIEPEMDGPEVDICKFQKKIAALQRTLGHLEPQKLKYEGNSKVSVDLDESSVDTSNSKENDSEVTTDLRKADINIVKQNLLNYNAYKTQMLRPRFKLSNISEKLYTNADTTGSSSDDNSGPHRIISSTVQFQNFLKTLTSASNSSFNFKNDQMF